MWKEARSRCRQQLQNEGGENQTPERRWLMSVKRLDQRKKDGWHQN
jgi:hypothetical protein